jgi:hypothetical protein
MDVRLANRIALLLAALIAAAGCKGAVSGGGGDPSGDDDEDPIDARTTADARRTVDARPGSTPDARPNESRPDAREPDDGDLTFRRANLTNFESYPEPGSDECEDFSGCEYFGQFAFVDGKQTEQWVREHNIVAVHSRDGDEFALKTLRLRGDGNEIDVTVYDICSDRDCNGCCTNNMRETGFLIDIEKYTMQRFGLGDGVIEFACLDCE